MADTVKKVKIPDGVRDLVEKLDYETQATKELLIQAAQMGINDNAAMEYWETRYKESFVEFQAAKAQIENDYVMPETNGKGGQWRLDYTSGVLSIW